MKMKYEKPRMDVETFTLNAAVASCDRLPGDYVYKPVEVKCVVTTSDVIFTAGTVGCVHQVDPNGGDRTYRFITYEGQLYFAWVGPSGSGGGNMQLLEKILRAGNIRGHQAENGMVWHAGPATKTLTQLYSHSF